MKVEEKGIWMQELLELGAKKLLLWDQKEIFVAPEMYFKNVEGIIADRLADEKQISNPELMELLSQKEPFEAPKGYFDSFPQRLQAKIQEEKSGQIKSLQQKTGWRFASIAAAILVFIVGSWLIFSPKISSDQLSDAEILAFIEVESIDAYTLAEVFDISEISIQDASNLSEDDIQDFLEGSDINEWDLENILEEKI